jgi:hypothetical protein
MKRGSQRSAFLILVPNRRKNGRPIENTLKYKLEAAHRANKCSQYIVYTPTQFTSLPTMKREQVKIDIGNNWSKVSILEEIWMLNCKDYIDSITFYLQRVNPKRESMLS